MHSSGSMATIPPPPPPPPQPRSWQISPLSVTPCTVVAAHTEQYSPVRGHTRVPQNIYHMCRGIRQVSVQSREILLSETKDYILQRMYGDRLYLVHRPMLRILFSEPSAPRQRPCRMFPGVILGKSSSWVRRDRTSVPALVPSKRYSFGSMGLSRGHCAFDRPVRFRKCPVSGTSKGRGLGVLMRSMV
jgi:hypothetical protein